MSSELVQERSEWVLKYYHEGGQFTWNSDIPLWDATTMLVGIFHILDLAPADIPTFVKANYETHVSVWWQDATYYEGMLGDLAGIALQEGEDEQSSTPAQGRGTR